VVGADGTSYGARAPAGKTWKQIFLDEVAAEIDPARLHFTGQLPYAHYLRLLQVSAAHVYLTYPFVLSWSLLEAMSAGCLVVASATPPVTEAVRDGENGLLFDFFERDQLADTVARALAEPDAMRPLRERARADVVARYDLHTVCLPQHLALAQQIFGGG
jgi:glycosyltransferase involved in cell wall biosynthesis